MKESLQGIYAYPLLIMTVMLTAIGCVPEIDIQRPVGVSIVDGGTDNVGNQATGSVDLGYTIENTGDEQLDVYTATASNYVNSSGFSVNSTLPVTVYAGNIAPLDVSFNIAALGGFKFDLSVDNSDLDEDPYNISVEGVGVAAPVVLFDANTTPTNDSVITTGPTQVFVSFSKDVKSDASAGAANNADNYVLLKAEGDGFQTVDCAAVASTGVDTNDTEISINTVAYDNNGGTGPFVASLDINDGIPLPIGTYRLYICGTTSIEDLDNIELNDGLADTHVNFIVSIPAPLPDLPDTGFLHGHVTMLPKQPAAKAYTETAMMLEIPKIGVAMPIVGVPQSASGWDVTWLGNSAGYLAGSAFPTWAGNTVITGHVWDAWNQPGLFSDLKMLKYGDQVQIQAWGLTYTYEVRESKLVTKKNVKSVLQSEDYDWVTLVTCEVYSPFTGDYLFRRAVRAVLVSVK